MKDLFKAACDYWGLVDTQFTFYSLIGDEELTKTKDEDMLNK